MNNVFSGNNAILDYLNPDNNPYIPLVELPEDLNPFKKNGVHIYAKLMHTLPLLNVKSIPAFNMLHEANQKGVLNDIHTIIENSSGNTVLSLSVIGKLMGINRTKAFVSHEVTEGKLKLLQLFGVAPIVNKEPICPDPSDKSSGIYKSKILGKQMGWFNAGQYDNPDNPSAHEKITGKQIWEQTDGKVRIFCAGLGTTGTMVGAGKFLKSKNKNIINLGVVRSPNNPVPGPRTENLLRQIAFDWRGIIDSLESVGTIDSYKYSLQLIRYGILAGPSSGFNLKGLLNYLEKLSKNNKLDELRDDNGNINAVFITCDTPLPYIDEYFRYLSEEDFPVIENKELLINAYQGNSTSGSSSTLLNIEVPEITVHQAYSQIFKEDPENLWDKINANETIDVKNDVVVFDIRKANDFDHFHIPSALNIQEEYIESNINYVAQKYLGRKILVVCYRGNSSQRVTGILKSKNLDAYSIKGGMIDWSENNLPRIRPEICKINHSA